MGIRSNQNWSDTIIAGVVLGVPAVDEVTGEFHWDGGVPNGFVDANGTFTPDGDEAVPVPMADLPGLKVPDWVQPTGAHDAHKQGVVVRDENGAMWENLTAANVHAPGVSGWRRIGDDPNEVFPWVQPTGAHDAYPVGALVTYNGQTWENTGSDANVWAPGVFGWVQI